MRQDKTGFRFKVTKYFTTSVLIFRNTGNFIDILKTRFAIVSLLLVSSLLSYSSN